MKRRGLSTIIGAVFFVLVMGSTIGYVTYSMDLLDDLAYQIDVKQDTNQNRQKEEFKISKSEIVDNKFNFTLQNNGNIPINITKLWVQNTTDSTWNQTKYQLNQLVSSGGTITNIGQNIPLIALTSESYKMKLVTERGNSEVFSIGSVSEQPLDIQLLAIPNIVATNFTTTLLMTIVNNMSSNNILLNVEPDTMSVSQACTTTCVYESGPEPTSYDSMKPGDVATFTWTYRLNGTNPESFNFTASIKNGFTGNNATATAEVKEVLKSSFSDINTVLLPYSSKTNLAALAYVSFFASESSSAVESDVQSTLRFDFIIERITAYVGDTSGSGNGTIIFRVDGADTLAFLNITSGQTGAYDSGPLSINVAKNSLINLKFDEEGGNLAISSLTILVEIRALG